MVLSEQLCGPHDSQSPHSLHSGAPHGVDRHGPQEPALQRTLAAFIPRVTNNHHCCRPGPEDAAVPTPVRSCCCASLGPRVPAPSNPACTRPTPEPQLLHLLLQSRPWLQGYSVCPHTPDPSPVAAPHMPTSQESEPMPVQAGQHPGPKGYCHSGCAYASDSVFVATSHTSAFHTSLLLQGNQLTGPQSCCCTVSTGTPSPCLYHCSTTALTADM